MTQWWNQRTAAASCSHVFRINWNLFLHELETLMRKLYISSKLWPQCGALFLLTVLRHDGSEPAPSLPLPPPPVCRWGRCIKESFSRWKQTPAAAHTEIFVTNCRISCRKMETLLTLWIALSVTASGMKTLSAHVWYLWMFSLIAAPSGMKTEYLENQKLNKEVEEIGQISLPSDGLKGKTQLRSF